MTKPRPCFHNILSSSIFLLLFFIILSPIEAQRGILKGQIHDSNGGDLAYASVFNTTARKGSVSNIDGHYFLEMPYGKHEIEFSFLGYKRQRLEVDIYKDTTVLDIFLKGESFLLPEIVVGLNEDPAYEMIRQAIKAREKNLISTGTFDASVYSKGIYKLEHISDTILGKALFDSTYTREEALGIIYLSEAESNFSLKYPNKIKEEIISSRVSGNSKGFSFNFTSMININLYGNMVQVPFDMSQRGFVSPISGNAMMYYRYRLVGSFLDGDFLVHKIELRPKRKIDRVFHGYLYLVEGLWCIHSASLIITEEAEIDFIDSIRINQEFKAVNDSMWALQTQNYDFDFSFNLFGIEASFNGHYLTIFNEYNWQPNFGPNFFNKEIFKIDKESNNKDSAYWEAKRPVPLSLEEQQNYIEFDSIEQKVTSKEYLDSMDRKHNKFKTWNFIQNGYTYRDRCHERKIKAGSPFTDITFNTVQGFRLKVPFSFRQEFENKEYFNQELDLAYGFSDELFDFNSHTKYYYDRNKFAKLEVDFGRDHKQFNGQEPISASINGLYSLFAEHNFMKLYRKTYLRLGHTSELFNGFSLTGKVEFSDRQPLANESSYFFRNIPDREYTPNTPWLDAGTNAGFIGHQACIISLGANYVIGQKYASLPYKIPLGSKYPPIGITYSKAVPGIFGSDANFDLIKINTSFSKSFGLVGQSQIKITYGRFLNSKKVYFNDYFHFNGNKTIFFMEGKNTFHLLDYYSYSTEDEFLEVHYQHHFNGFIINKIPWVRKSKFRMVAGANYLFQQTNKQYIELTIGVKNIMKIGRIDFVTAFDNDKKLRTGVTLSFRM